MLWTVFIFWN